MVMSRPIKVEERDVPEDGWTQGIHFNDETLAKQELKWLKSHSYLREYKLVARITKGSPLVELFLDDDLAGLY